MKIYILEDDIVQQFRLENFITRYLKEKKYPITDVVVYGKPREFLAILGELSQNNIYFLDIAIKNNPTAGLKIAEKIRQRDTIGQISFVTIHLVFAANTYDYKVNAHDFINKLLPQDVFDRKIKENIDHFIQINRLKPIVDIFSYTSRTGKIIEASYVDIIYFETTGIPHKLLLQMDGETLTIYGNMNEISKLSDRFIRIHRSYLINQERLEKLNRSKKVVVLDDGTELPVSRKGIKRLELYWEFLKK